jgi:5-methylcytosine-specific restriction endonuclease McrA
MGDGTPKKRLPREVWRAVRQPVWERDQGMCQYPNGRHPVALSDAHIDHVVSGTRGTNTLSELRMLWRMHQLLRADKRHRRMIAWALRDGVIPSNWRELVWDG